MTEGSSVASPGDIDSIAACIAQAFATDPIWSVALMGMDAESYWRFFVESSMQLGTVRQWDSGAAVSVWVPPNESAIAPTFEAAYEALIARSLDAEHVTA